MLLEGTPGDVLDVGFEVRLLREDHLRRPVLVVVSRLLLAALALVPHEYLTILCTRHEQVLVVRRPLDLCDRLLVIVKVINEVLGHAQVPNVNHA